MKFFVPDELMRMVLASAMFFWNSTRLPFLARSDSTAKGLSFAHGRGLARLSRVSRLKSLVQSSKLVRIKFWGM